MIQTAVCQDIFKDLEPPYDLEKATVHGFELKLKNLENSPSICPAFRSDNRRAQKRNA